MYLAERNRPRETQLYRAIRGEIIPTLLRTSLAPMTCFEEHGVGGKYYDMQFSPTGHDAFRDGADRVLQRLSNVGF